MLYKKSKEKSLSNELFKNPTSEYRGTPFWSWNCKMNEEMLGEQIEYLHEMGFGGFHIHSRSGMSMPYLKEDFMNLVRFCTDKAKKEGMLAYLYDEDRWPSGSAGGYVTKNPRFRQRILKFSPEKPEHYSLDESINEGKTYLLATFDVVINENGEIAEYRRIAEDDTAKGDKWYAYIVSAEESSWYNNQTYVDTLNKEAIDKFIDITYNAYENTVGDEFGKTVPSMFTDEPQFVGKFPLSFAHSKDTAHFPWTYSVPESFEKAYGYDLVEKLPELIWNLPDGAPSTVRYNFHDHICDLFTEAFADNCGEWCREHGLAFTGHMVNESSLGGQTANTGEVMRPYRALDIPGIDILCNSIQLNTAKQCQSVVHQYGREGMLSELYGVTNWDFDFRGHKFQGDWQAALGVTLRVPHLSWVSMEGEAKRDYPASINYQSPWFREYKYIEDHFARLNTALTRGKPVVKVGVIHPIESYWLNFGSEDTTFEIREQLDNNFADITKWLLYGTMDFDFISESLLPDEFNGTEGGLCVGEMKYDVIVVANCLTLRQSTVDILKRFADDGGKIVFVGDCPKYIDAKVSDGVHALYDSSVCVPHNGASLTNALKEFRMVDIKNDNGRPTDNLIYNMREDNDCSWLFIAHGTEYPENIHVYRGVEAKAEVTFKQSVKIKITGEFTPMLYDTLSGEICDIPYTVENGKTVIEHDFYTHDSLLLKLCAYDGSTNAVNEKSDARTPSRTFRIMDKVEYERSEPNVLLLDRAEYSLNGGEFKPEEEMLILDGICHDEMGWPENVGTQPWVLPDDPIVDFVTLRIAVNSEIDYKGAHLAAENAENLEICFNGTEVHANVDGYYVDKCIKTVPLPEIKKGKNELVLKVPFGKRTHIEWCYILGDFGVMVEGTQTTIVADKEKIGFSSLTMQNMPFYGGNITYRFEVETPECDMAINTIRYRGALVKVRVDGKEAGVSVFAPYKLNVEGLSRGKHTIEITLFGTRINTFGGLHDVMECHWTGPNIWRTSGNELCYEYILKETGILASPIIEIFEK